MKKNKTGAGRKIETATFEGPSGKLRGFGEKTRAKQY